MSKSKAAREQDDRWRQFVASPKSSHLPFEEQLAAYREIFAGRAPEDGPAVAWSPASDSFRDSNLGRWMAERGQETYEGFHRWTVENRDEFWRDFLIRASIRFDTAPETILSGDPREPGWLAGAEFNIVESCFQAPAEAPAMILGQEGTTEVERVSFGELEARVRRVAAGFQSLGISERDRVALYLPMTRECVEAYLALVLLGAAVISIADSFTANEVQARLQIAEATAILTVDAQLRAGKRISLYDKVRDAVAPRAFVIPLDPNDPPHLRDGDVLWEAVLSANAASATVPRAPGHVINILFSSGTTGTPKAIPWTQLTPLKCAMDGYVHQDIREGDIVAWPTNIGWMMGPWLIFASLLNRAAIALYEGAPHGEGFTSFVDSAQVTMLGVVPALVRAWRAGGSMDAGRWSSIRAFSSTGEPSNVEDYLWLMSRCDFRAPVIEYLGGTEIGGGHITGTVVQDASPATFTTPAAGVDFVLLDEEHSPVPDGHPGELFLIPPAIGLSERLLNADHDRVYFEGTPEGPRGETLRRHGDQFVKLAGGFYRAQGRTDDTMNLGGIKVASLEIERVLNTHDEIAECAAVGVQLGGEGAEKLVVFAIPEAGASPTHDALRTDFTGLLAKRLNPLFKIHEVMIVESLPRTASNKLMRRKLISRYQENETAR